MLYKHFARLFTILRYHTFLCLFLYVLKIRFTKTNEVKLPTDKMKLAFYLLNMKILFATTCMKIFSAHTKSKPIYHNSMSIIAKRLLRHCTSDANDIWLKAAGKSSVLQAAHTRTWPRRKQSICWKAMNGRQRSHDRSQFVCVCVCVCMG